MSNLYGNLTNRIMEDRNYNGREIEIGDDITMFLWSDRRCYYVSEIVSRKPLKIKVKPYFVCADKEKACGMGHQDWKYFRSLRKYREYLGYDQFDVDNTFSETDYEETWVFRYNKWQSEHIVRGGIVENPEIYSDREIKSFQKNGYLKTYFDLSGKVSFGIRDYYHDWEF